MAIIDLKPASYKGITFLMSTAATSGGMKDMLFEFPNSNKQVIEQFGKKVRAYNITAIIPHDDYYTKRDALLKVLDEGGRGPLEHPTFGKIEDIVVRTFVLNETVSELGRAKVQITFAVSDDLGVPQKAVNSISEVDLANDALTEVVVFETTETFIVDTGFTGNFQDAQELLNDVGDAFDSAVNTVTAISDKINEFSAELNSYVDDINKLISLPDQLTNSVKNLFSTVNGLYSAVESAVIVYTELFNFGDTDTPIVQSTAGLKQRADNRVAFKQYMQSSSLGYAYLNAVQIDYQTTDGIDKVNEVLEAQYQKILSDQEYNDGTKRALTNVRTVSNQLLDDKRIDAKKIITVYTHRRPMSEIAYEYYGNTELTDTLLELNNIDNAGFVEGNIKILTE